MIASILFKAFQKAKGFWELNSWLLTLLPVNGMSFTLQNLWWFAQHCMHHCWISLHAVCAWACTWAFAHAYLTIIWWSFLFERSKNIFFQCEVGKQLLDYSSCSCRWFCDIYFIFYSQHLRPSKNNCCAKLCCLFWNKCGCLQWSRTMLW